MWAEHRARLEFGSAPLTTAPVVAQVSRSTAQVQLRRFLRGCEVIGFDVDDAHPVGALLAATGTSDPVDAHLTLVAGRHGSTVLTSDPRDLRRLAAHVPGNVRVRTLS